MPNPHAQTLEDRVREMAEWDWVQTVSREGSLHCPEGVTGYEDWDTSGELGGSVLCGIEGPFVIAGLFSRMGQERCKRCCDKLGWPRGTGSPKNDEALRSLVEARIEGTE